MKKKYYIKDKLFLRVFCISTAVVLFMVFLISGIIYRLSFKTLQQEIIGMNENVAKVITNRFDDAINKTFEKTIEFETNETVKLFFASDDPEYLIDDYYIKLQNKLSTAGIPYIDNVILFSNNQGKIFDNVSFSVYDFDSKTPPKDLNWIENFENYSQSFPYIRAYNDRWPYYITVGRKCNSKQYDGYVFININLEKLYDYLTEDQSDDMLLYFVNEDLNVVLNRNKTSLVSAKENFDDLRRFEPQKDCKRIDNDGNNSTAYIQVYSEKYHFTCVTVTQIGNYYSNVVKFQRSAITIISVAAIIGVFCSVIYTIKAVKPRQVSIQLKEELKYRTDLLNDAQMMALQVQMNPHFLFNTLNIISLMIESDFGENHPASQMMIELSDILRYSISQSKTVSIKEEVAYAEKYISLMKYRYNNFSVTFDVDSQLESCEVPRMILQPLVENSLQHGILPQGEKNYGEINVKIKMVEYKFKGENKDISSIYICVADNGMGITEERLNNLKESITHYDVLPEKHIGILNVVQRLRLLFKEQLNIEIDSVVNGGTKIEFIFPLYSNENTD